MKNEIVLKKRYEQIKQYLQIGADNWVEAGKLIVLCLKEGQTLKEVAEGLQMDKSMLEPFVKMGRGDLIPQLFNSVSPGCCALRRCDGSEQSYYMDNPVNVLLLGEGGQTDTLKVKVSAMTVDQAKQVFFRGHIRDDAEQRAYIESERAKSRNQIPATGEAPYTIHGKRVFFRKELGYTKDELIQLIARM